MRRRPRALARRWRPAVSLALLLAAGAARGDAPVAPHPNVLLISIDTLRADHLHAYGYARKTSPNLDRLAQQGVLFEQAISDTSWTLPAHMTLMTGLPARVHGVSFDGTRLDPARHTLAQRFAAAGYHTRAIVSAPYLHPIFGFGRGFEHYRVLGETVYDQKGFHLGDTQRDRQVFLDKIRFEKNFESRSSSEEIARRVDAALDDLAGKPFFLFVHMFDPHDDFVPPEPYWRRFDPDYKGSFDPHGYAHNEAIKHGMPARDLRNVIARYDGEILWTDEHVGKMLASLDRHGLTDRTLVVVVSDHGEEFFEHGGKGHRSSLFDEELHVALLMRWPGHLPADRRVKQQVRLMDVAPTLLALAGLPPDDEEMGVSLVPWARGSLDARDLPAVSELVFPDHAFWRSLRTPRWKLIEIRRPGESQPAWSLFFDLRRDPGEHHPLNAPKLRARARAALDAAVKEQEAWRARLAPAGDDSISLPPDMRRALQELGYVAPEQPPRSGPREP